MDNFDLRKFISEGRLFKEEMEVDPQGNLTTPSGYYAIVNHMAEQGTSYYIITDTKEDLVNKINQAINLNREEGITLDTYDIEDFPDVSEYPHLYEDDWISSTDKKEVFQQEMEEFTDIHGNYPKKLN